MNVTVYCPGCGTAEQVEVRPEAVQARGGRLHVSLAPASVEHVCPDRSQDRLQDPPEVHPHIPIPGRHV